MFEAFESPYAELFARRKNLRIRIAFVFANFLRQSIFFERMSTVFLRARAKKIFSSDLRRFLFAFVRRNIFEQMAKIFVRVRAKKNVVTLVYYGLFAFDIDFWLHASTVAVL